MARNDIFFKILFAIEVALLPLIIFSYHFVQQAWVMGILIAGVMVCRIWMEIFKDKHNFQHNVINSIGSIATIGIILIFLASVKVVVAPIAIVAVIMVVLGNVMKIAMFNKHMPDMINAVDLCYTMFECTALLTFAFARMSTLISNLGMFTLIITSAVSVVYKIYFAFKYTDLWNNIKKFFTRK